MYWSKAWFMRRGESYQIRKTGVRQLLHFITKFRIDILMKHQPELLTIVKALRQLECIAIEITCRNALALVDTKDISYQ